MGIEGLHSSIQKKEAQVLGKNPDEHQKEGEDNDLTLVNEKQVYAEIKKLEKKVEGSALKGTKFEEKIKGELEKATDKWQSKFDRFKAKQGQRYEKKFKSLFDKTLGKVKKLESNRKVKNLIKNVEPLLENKDAIKEIINLDTYERRSGHWKKINADIHLLGISREQIAGIQKYLKIRVDGKIGPQTITAINKSIYEEDKKVIFAEETRHNTETREEFDMAQQEVVMAMGSDEWKTVEEEELAELKEHNGKKPKTLDDIIKWERKNDAIKKKYFEKRKALIKTARERTDLQLRRQQSITPGTESPDQISEADLDQLLNPQSIDPSLPQVLPQDPGKPVAQTPGQPAVTPQDPGKPTAKIPAKSPEAVEETIDISDIPKEFIGLCKELSMSEEATSEYYKAYLATPEGARLSLDKIKSKISEITEKFLKVESKTIKLGPFELETDGINPTVKKNALIEAFGKLIQGQTQDLLPVHIYESNIERTKADMERTQDEINEKLKDISGAEKIIDMNIKTIAEYTKKEASRWVNGDLYEEMVADSIDQLKEWQGRLAENQEELLPLQDKQKAIFSETFTNQYYLLETEGKGTREVLMMMDSTLIDEVPEEFKESIAAIREQNTHNYDIPIFERLIYEERYDEALQALTESREETRHQFFTEGELVRMYRKGKEKGSKGYNFPAGSYAAKKISEGYISVPVSEGVKDTAYPLIKEDSAGNLHYVYVLGQDGRDLGEGGEKRGARKGMISVDKLDEKEGLQDSQEKGLQMILTQSPTFKTLNKNASYIQKKFGRLQKLFISGQNGNKSAGFISLAKQYAREIAFSPEFKELKAILPQAKSELAKLGEFRQGIEDGFEGQISKMQQGLSEVTEMVGSGKVENFCKEIMKGAYSEDDFYKWITEDALPFMASIMGAVIAIGLVCTGVGAGAGIFLMAGVGTIGGMAGNELGHLLSDGLGKMRYGDTYSNKTSLQQLIVGEEVFNPATGQYEKVEGMKVLQQYSLQAAIGFVSTFALLGAGKVVGKYLSNFVGKYATATGKKAAVAKFLGRIPKLNKQKIDLLKQKGHGKMLNRLMKETFEETGEEGAESAAEKISPGLGYVVSLYNCLDGRSTEYSLGKFNVVSEGSVEISDTNVETNWSYDATQKEAMFAKLKKKYGDSAKKDGNGDLIVEKSHTTRKGTTYKSTMKFKGTQESIAMRQLLRNRMDAETGKSEAERLYGLKKTGEKKYSYDALKPDGKISLVKYLKQSGFIVSGDVESGTFKARKGEVVVDIKPSTIAKHETTGRRASTKEAEQHLASAEQKLTEVKAKKEAATDPEQVALYEKAEALLVTEVAAAKQSLEAVHAKHDAEIGVEAEQDQVLETEEEAAEGRREAIEARKKAVEAQTEADQALKTATEEEKLVVEAESAATEARKEAERSKKKVEAAKTRLEKARDIGSRSKMTPKRGKTIGEAKAALEEAGKEYEAAETSAAEARVYAMNVKDFAQISKTKSKKLVGIAEAKLSSAKKKEEQAPGLTSKVEEAKERLAAAEVALAEASRNADSTEALLIQIQEERASIDEEIAAMEEAMAAEAEAEAKEAEAKEAEAKEAEAKAAAEASSDKDPKPDPDPEPDPEPEPDDTPPAGGPKKAREQEAAGVDPAEASQEAESAAAQEAAAEKDASVGTKETAVKTPFREGKLGQWVNKRVEGIKSIELKQGMTKLWGTITGPIKSINLSKVEAGWAKMKGKLKDRQLRRRTEKEIKEVAKKQRDVKEVARKQQEKAGQVEAYFKKHSFTAGDSIFIGTAGGGVAAMRFHKMNPDGTMTLEKQTSDGTLGEFITVTKEDIVDANPNGPVPGAKNSQEIIDRYMEGADQFEATLDILGDRNLKGFKIKRTIKIGKNIFHIGPTYVTHGGRIEVIMLVDRGDGSGKLYPRIMYKSGSSSGLRGSQGSEMGGRYRKGWFENTKYNTYTHETRVDDRLSGYLDMTEREGMTVGLAKGIDPMRNHFSQDKTEIHDTYGVKIFKEGHSKLLPFFSDGFMPGDLSGKIYQHTSDGEFAKDKDGFKIVLGYKKISAAQYFASLDATFPPGFTPDFTRPMGQPKTRHHKFLGDYKVYSYEGSLAGEKVVWQMATDSENRVWIDSIRLKNVEVSSYGIDRIVIPAGLLTHKPLEYDSQTSALHEGAHKVKVPGSEFKDDYGNVTDWYTDITPTLDALLPIRQFRHAMGIHRGVAPVSAVGK